MSEKESISKAPSGRPSRVPVGYRNRFDVSGKDANFHYRIVKDHEGRIQEFLDAGYEVVDKAKTKLGADRLEGGSTVGSVSSIPLGGGDTGVLMRIPKVYYDEDQKAKEEKVKENLQALREPTRNGTFTGGMEVS